MPQFTKTADELETDQDKWFYLFKNLHKLDDIPSKLKEAIFVNFFEKAQIAHFTPLEREAYEDSLKYYRDLKNSIDTAKDEGRQEEKLAIARNMLAKGLDDELITQMTGLSINQIARLRYETD